MGHHHGFFCTFSKKTGSSSSSIAAGIYCSTLYHNPQELQVIEPETSHDYTNANFTCTTQVKSIAVPLIKIRISQYPTYLQVRVTQNLLSKERTNIYLPSICKPRPVRILSGQTKGAGINKYLRLRLLKIVDSGLFSAV